MYVDSHCHLEIEEFDDDRARVIEKSLAEGLVYLLTVGTESRYFSLVRDLVETYPQVYGALGLHPHNATDCDEASLDGLKESLSHPKMVALGEIGLDFFKNYSPRPSQIAAFEGQIELARTLRLPIIVHSRSSKEETLAILERHAGNLSAGGVIHCFSYDLETARKVLDMGFYISIPGTVTYTKNAGLVEVVEYVPADRILAETDAPFLAPIPYRGKRNVPYFVKITVERVAAIRKTTIEEMALTIRRNFETLFFRDRKGEQ